MKRRGLRRLDYGIADSYMPQLSVGRWLHVIAGVVKIHHRVESAMLIVKPDFDNSIAYDDLATDGKAAPRGQAKKERRESQSSASRREQPYK
jgi:hypothetical protein